MDNKKKGIEIFIAAIVVLMSVSGVMAQMYLIDDNFDSGTTGADPAGWWLWEDEPAGDIIQVNDVLYYGASGKSVELISSSDSVGMGMDHPPISRTVTYEVCVRSDDVTSGETITISPQGSSGPWVTMAWHSGKLSYFDGRWYDIQDISADTWYKIKIVADVPTNTFDIYVDDMNIPVLTGCDFRDACTQLDGLTIQHWGKNDVAGYVDEVKAYTDTIDEGIAWLAAQQNPDGSWGTSDTVGRTGLAVKKLEHHAVDCKYGHCLDSPFNPAYPYAENVSRGLDYLFNHSYIIPIGMQTHGNPDTDGDGIGVYFVDGTDPHHRNYETGIALMAIAESTTPDRMVDVPGSAVNGWTYYEVAVDTMNYLAWAQAETNGRGGWGYAQCDNGTWTDLPRSDNSNSGWVVLGLQYAETKDPLQGFNIPIPQFVKDELNIWIDYIQCKPGKPGYDPALDGGSGYTAPCEWVNILKTGNLLKEMAFVGDTKDTPRVQNANDYICRHWMDDNDDPGWRPNNYHAMYTTMKGFVSLDIHETCGYDWQAEFEDAIVAQQNPDGSWSGCKWGDPILCTEWALLTLQKAAPPPKPAPAPVPTLTPVGLIAMIGLLSVIAAISIRTSIRKKRR